MYFIYMPDSQGEKPIDSGRSLQKMMYKAFQLAAASTTREAVHFVYVEKGVPTARWIVKFGKTAHLQIV
jgi:hypothetical protein